MKTTDKYKLELTPYFNCRGKKRSDLSAKYMYGKFLRYVSADDYIGASLAKKFIRKGWNCCTERDYPNNNFKYYYNQIKTDPKFRKVKNDFFCKL